MKNIRFAEILLPSEEPFTNYSTEESGEHNVISSMSLVNIFIGANNSGKSRFLRSLFALKEFKYNTKRYNANTFNDFLKDFNGEYIAVFPPDVKAIGDLQPDYLQHLLDSERRFIDQRDVLYKIVEQTLQNFASSLTSARITNKNNEHESNEQSILLVSQLRGIGEKFQKRFMEIEFDPDLDNEKRYYIPILRGMRPFDSGQTNPYKSRTIEDYFLNLSGNMEIFTGLELYQILKGKLLGEPEDRKSVKEFEEFLSKNFFNSRPITLIPREGDTTVHIKIGDEKQLPIYNLGDGLQGLIICTFNIFMEKERCLFFIEEPDLFMHPSMQRSFLKVLSDHDQHQYFITSHSNHLLDMTLDFDDISVFHFSKVEDVQPRFNIRVASSNDHRVLVNLGVQNSSVFLTNATIWVEGITDRLYLRAYMEKYIKELPDSSEKAKLENLREDCHYSFVEYQGSNLTHWSFDPDDEGMHRIKATYVCAHAFLIADGDVATKGEREAIYKQMLGDRFLILDTKEIENLMPSEVLKRVVNEKFQKYSQDPEQIKYEGYANEKPIGRYLDSFLSLPEGKTVFAAESGTLKSKVDFCDKAVKVMRDPDFNWSLTSELKDICKKLFEHIVTQNLPNA